MEIRITRVAPQLTNGPEEKKLGNRLEQISFPRDLQQKNFPAEVFLLALSSLLPEHDLMRKYVKMFKIGTSGRVLQRLEIKVQ